MKIGYVRTVEGYEDIMEQGFKLGDYGVDMIIPESDERNMLSIFLPEIEKKENPELIITKLLVLDDTIELFDIMREIENRKIKLTILNQ